MSLKEEFKQFNESMKQLAFTEEDLDELAGRPPVRIIAILIAAAIIFIAVTKLL